MQFRFAKIFCPTSLILSVSTITVGAVAFSVHSWRPHIFSLLLRTWDSFVKASGTSTTGVLLWVIALPALIWLVVNVGDEWVKCRNAKIPAAIYQAFRNSIRSGFRTTLVVTLFTMTVFGVFLVRTVYEDHQALTKRNKQLAINNAAMSQELEWRKHNVSATDAVFPNLIYMLQAVRSFKRDMNGIPCVLYISAPKETEALASVMAQLAGPEAGCTGIGPVAGDNLDLDPELAQGMVPEAIVVHAAKGERAANGLFATLGNQIHLEASYRLLRNPQERWTSTHQGREHLVWLQFGTKVQWNSELR